MTSLPAMRGSIWVYPWDIAAEGIRGIVDRVAGLHLDAINLAVVYHGSYMLLPRHPDLLVRSHGGEVFFGTESDWPNDPNPRVSDLAERLPGLDEIIEVASGRGISVRAWIVAMHNSGIAERNPELAVETAFGGRLPFALCPSNGAVEKYLTTVVSRLSRFAFESIDLETLFWMEGKHDGAHAKLPQLPQTVSAMLGVCFCAKCVELTGHETDLTVLRTRVREWCMKALRDIASDDLTSPQNTFSWTDTMSEIAGLSVYLQQRSERLSQLLARLQSRTKVPLRPMLGSGYVRRQIDTGIDLSSWAEIVDSFVVNGYYEDLADAQYDVSIVQRAGARSVAMGISLISNFSRRREYLNEAVTAASEMGVQEVSFYNYGLAMEDQLDRIPEALERRT